MIYAKSFAVAVFTFGNAGLEISKAKQKGQQTAMSEACCGTSSFFFSLSDTSSASSTSALFFLTSKILAVQVELRGTSKMLNAASFFER